MGRKKASEEMEGRGRSQWKGTVEKEADKIGDIRGRKRGTGEKRKESQRMKSRMMCEHRRKEP